MRSPGSVDAAMYQKYDGAGLIFTGKKAGQGPANSLAGPSEGGRGPLRSMLQQSMGGLRCSGCY